MKTQLPFFLIFFLFFSILITQGCSAGGGAGAGDPAAGGSGGPAPIVVAKSTDGSSGAVSIDATVSVIFSTAMDATTITTSTFTVGAVSGTVAYNSSTKTATFTPSSPLANGANYTATITTGVKEAAGTAIANSFTWTFSTVQIVPGPLGPTTLMGGAIQGNSLNPVPGIVTLLAGTSAGSGATDGPAASATFNYPYGTTTDGTNLFVADGSSHSIRKIVIATGAVTTLAGGSGASGSTNGTGTAARFLYPYSVTTDGTNVFVADKDNHTIRQIVISTGVVTTLAGSAGISGLTDGTGSAARFLNPHGITTDNTNLYVTSSGHHTVRKIVIASGVVTTIAGDPTTAGSTDAIGTAARFNYPYGIETDGTNLYVSDASNHTIRKIVISTNTVTTLAGSAGTFGSTDGIGTAARFKSPAGITTDGTNLYIADKDNHTIRKLVIATGVVSSIAGAGYTGYANGTGSAAVFGSPHGITTNGTNLFVSDSGNHNLRKISAISVAPSTAPAGLTIIGGNAQAIFSWSSVSGATSYNLYCAAGTSVTTTTGTKIANIASPYYLGSYWTATPIAIVNDSNYACIVTAVNSIGESAASSPVTFTPTATYLLSVSVSGTNSGTGTITSSPSVVSCGSVCSANVANGATVTLTATPATGSTFTGWSGACSGTGTCTLTMNSVKTAGAIFAGTVPGGGSYYYVNWNCNGVAGCISAMGGTSGSVGNYCTLSDCDACRTTGCIGMFGATCSLTANSTIRIVSPSSNGLCQRSGFDF